MVIALGVLLILLFSSVVTFGGIFIFFSVKFWLEKGAHEFLLFALGVFAVGYLLCGLFIAAIYKVIRSDSFKNTFIEYLKLLRFLPKVLSCIIWFVGGFVLLKMPFDRLKDLFGANGSVKELGIALASAVLWVLLTYFGRRVIRKIRMGNIDPESIEWKDFYHVKDIRTLVAAVDNVSTLNSSKLKGKKGDVYSVSIFCAGFYDEEKGELIPERGNLHWYVKRFMGSESGRIKGFKEKGLYRVRVRELRYKDDSSFAEAGNNKKYHRFFLESIVDKNVQCPELQAYWDEYNKPVIIKDDFFGELILNKTEERFEGEKEFGGRIIEINIMVECEPVEWSERIRNAALLVGDIAQFDEKCKRYASRYLLDDVYDMLESDGEDPSEQTIYDNIFLMSISVGETDIDAVYDSDELCYASIVTVNIDKEKGPCGCYMEC